MSKRQKYWKEYGRDSCIRGYHIFKDIWAAAIGEVLECVREPSNDTYSSVEKQSILKDAIDNS